MKYDRLNLWADRLEGRTPQGVRGLKSSVSNESGDLLASHPARGAWIEICCPFPLMMASVSHPARGAWIEIAVTITKNAELCRTPQGVRGLKSNE